MPYLCETFNQTDMKENFKNMGIGAGAGAALTLIIGGIVGKVRGAAEKKKLMRDIEMIGIDVYNENGRKLAMPGRVKNSVCPYVKIKELGDIKSFTAEQRKAAMSITATLIAQKEMAEAEQVAENEEGKKE